MSPEVPHVAEPMRIAMLSVHTSPLLQPGVGDAGGMNVYVDQLSRALVAGGDVVDVYTRRTSATEPDVVEPVPGYRVHAVRIGETFTATKEELPALMPEFARQVCAMGPVPQAIHAHYWLSGVVAEQLRSQWQVPFGVTMHTLAEVKNAHLARGDQPEPAVRLTGERAVLTEADVVFANTAIEAQQLCEHYQVCDHRVCVAPPGVDTALFAPVEPAVREQIRREHGVSGDDLVLLFVGRLQPLKAPDVFIAAVADLVRNRPDLRSRLRIWVNGGESGAQGFSRDDVFAWAAQAGLNGAASTGRLRVSDPVPRAELADLYRCADLVVVPSRNESFGLVALEAQASGTPVVATDVGGLAVVVRDGYSGTLVRGHQSAHWAQALATLIDQPATRAAMARRAVAHADQFSWARTAHTLRTRLAQARANVAGPAPQADASAPAADLGLPGGAR